jgi:two-component system, chemotaxis family, chemotaxis protein CheY
MKHCLLVDDSDVIRKITKQLLSGLSLELSEAENGQRALEACQARMPDAILLDWHMPFMTGVEFLSALRQQPDGDKPIVFYCTTENDPVDIARALAAGADEYILKPYDRDGIRQKLIATGLA